MDTPNDGLVSADVCTADLYWLCRNQPGSTSSLWQCGVPSLGWASRVFFDGWALVSHTSDVEQMLRDFAVDGVIIIHGALRHVFDSRQRFLGEFDAARVVQMALAIDDGMVLELPRRHFWGVAIGPRVFKVCA